MLDIKTHFTGKSFIKLKGLQIYNTPNPDNDAKGGSAIVIRDSINHYEDHPVQLKEVQLSTAVIKSTKKDFKIVAIYCPPRHNLKSEHCKEILRHMGERLIVGDINAKHTEWGARLITTK